jgi:hypothetical protein
MGWEVGESSEQEQVCKLTASSFIVPSWKTNTH